jgi:hypothetical protein
MRPGFANVVGSDEQRDEFATEQAVVRRDRPANTEVGDLAREAALPHLG